MKYSDAELRETEAHRHQCECDFLASLPLMERRKRLDGIGKKRGTAALERIKATLIEMHQRRKAA